MYRSGDILHSARAIRPYLPELLAPRVAEVDYRLARLLALAESEVDVVASVQEVLVDRPRTRAWMDHFVRHKSPPYLYDPLVGTVALELDLPVVLTTAEDVAPPGLIEAHEPLAKYACPEGDWAWYQQSVGQPVPPCPTHGRQLLKVSGPGERDAD